MKSARASASQLAEFISQNLPFDRLYFYGQDRPVHVSIGPDASRAVLHLVPLANGRRIPRRIANLAELPKFP